MAGVIKDLRARPFDLPLVEPFIIATGRKDAANNVLVEVELDDGTIGYGEVAPSPYTTGDTAATCLAIIEQLRPLVVGKDVRQWRSLLSQTRRAVRHQFAAHSGLEIAILDAFGKVVGVPLYQFFGGVTTRIDSDYTLSLGSPQETAASARKAIAAGFRKIKIKVGMGVATDVARVCAVREVAPHAELSLDANQAFSPQAAVDLARRLAAEGVELALLEQPVRRDDIAGMRFVRERAGVPVGADESVFTPEDAIRVVREGAADVINIKVAKAGLLGALDIYSIVRSANLELMIGCMMESKVGLAASVHLACGLGCFTHCDLDSVFLLKPFDCAGGYTLSGATFDVEGHGPGTGITLSEA
ncbi:MAG: dipeptide epimerase [Candidatus Sumerlaeaceae bacterium]|jgi:L-alanine-DL-glutamate epimerase-like enolase superfamily enzyme